MFKDTKIGVVIPCYRVKEKVLSVVDAIPAWVDVIYCVDDGCPENSISVIENRKRSPSIHILRHSKNRGVGAATITGFSAAVENKCDILVKVDGDGQMNPQDIERFIRPIIEGVADYTKGNRFYQPAQLQKMPGIRLFGNCWLSLIAKLVSGYWKNIDPTNGFICIHASVFQRLQIVKIAPRYFFENDMLYQLALVRAVVKDIPIAVQYADEKSSLNISAVIFTFPSLFLKRFVKRIVYLYFIRDFNVGTISLFAGSFLASFGILFGSYHWILSGLKSVPATAGTVMLAAFTFLIGFQLLLNFVNYDIQSEPKEPVQGMLP